MSRPLFPRFSLHRPGFFAFSCVLSLIFFSFAGCTVSQEMPTGFSSAPRSAQMTGNLFGSYLAGGFAGATRDTKSAAVFYRNALSRDPDNAVILERAFLLALADGQFQQARRMAEEIVERDSGNRMARLVLGLDAFERNEFALARFNLDESRKGPITVLVRDLVAAWSHAGEGDYDQAIQSIDAGARVTNFDIFYASNRAFLNDLAERSDEAEQDYLNALEGSRGRSRQLVRAYGRFLERNGRESEAGSLYQDYIETIFDDEAVQKELDRLNDGGSPQRIISSPRQAVASGLYGAATYLAQERNVDLPIVYLRLALELDPDFHEARLLLSDLFEVNGGWEDALRVLEDIPKSSDLYRNAQIQMAINLDRSGEMDEAIKRLQRLSRSRPDDYDVIRSLGDLLRRDERYEESIESYNRAIDLYGPVDQNAWSLYYSRGVGYERTKQWDLAEKDFLKAIDLSPDQPLTLNYLGYSWIEMGINYEEATDLIRRAVSLSPDDGFIVDSLGWALFRQGQYEAAVEYLERAVNLQPNDPVINEHLGDAYWKVGRRIEARFQWRQSLDLNPEDDLIPKIQKKLDRGLI